MIATVTAAVADSSAAPLAGSALAHSLAPLAPAQRSTHIEALVLRVVRELTGAPSSALTGETPLMEAGIDSLAATELSWRLRAVAGVGLSQTLVFEHPTPRAIAAQILEETCQG